MPESPSDRLVVTSEPAQMWATPDLRTPGRVLPDGTLARVVRRHALRPRWVLIQTEDDEEGWVHTRSLASAVSHPTGLDAGVAGEPYPEAAEVGLDPGESSLDGAVGEAQTPAESSMRRAGTPTPTGSETNSATSTALAAGAGSGRRWTIGKVVVGGLLVGLVGLAVVGLVTLSRGWQSLARPAPAVAPAATSAGTSNGQPTRPTATSPAASVPAAARPAATVAAAGSLAESAPPAPDDGCAAGEKPVFVGGFAALRATLGALMGDPLSCERYGPEGDALQQTTTGLARYTKASNVASFTRGADHWALTDRGLVHWTGHELEPPPPAEAPVQHPEPTVAPARLAPAPRPTVSAAAIADGSWLERPLRLVREYDRLHGTILSQALGQVRIVVVHIPGAWAAFVPAARSITLDPVLAQETPEAVATVLVHEANHAVDWVLYGATRSEVACYNYEISSFRLQAAMWQGLYGAGGKPDPETELESELNEVLQLAHTDAGRLISGIQSRYQDVCA